MEPHGSCEGLGGTSVADILLYICTYKGPNRTHHVNTFGNEHCVKLKIRQPNTCTTSAYMLL